MASKLRVTQLRSTNGTNKPQRETLRSLGLGRIGRSADLSDTPAIRGMINRVGHLVRVMPAGGDK